MEGEEAGQLWVSAQERGELLAKYGNSMAEIDKIRPPLSFFEGQRKILFALGGWLGDGTTGI